MSATDRSYYSEGCPLSHPVLADGPVGATDLGEPIEYSSYPTLFDRG